MKKMLKIATNKFFLTAIAFVVWMGYFDQHDWVSMQERREDLQVAKANVEYLNKEIKKMEQEHAAITNNPSQLEKFAREQYRMKRDNEDVYVID